MKDLPELILLELEKSSPTNSPTLAKKFDVDEQKIVGAIKSLEALGEDVIKTEIQQVPSWKLSSEGQEVAKEGSHEARLFALVPKNQGIEQAKLMAQCGKWGKIGFSKAMSAGWIQINK